MSSYSHNGQRPARLPERIRLPDGSTRTDSATYTAAEIETAGYVEAPPKPEHDSATEAPAKWVDGEWKIRSLTDDELAALARKIWPNAADFLGEFTFPKLVAISLSTDPTVAALRLLLASWPGEVWSDDPRVIAGLDAIEAAGILTHEERAEKFTKL